MAVVLQESLRAVFYAPYYAALALKAYEDEGVDVTFMPAAPPGHAALGLLDGSVDVVWGGPMRVMQTYAQEPDCDLVCFGEVVTRDPFMIVGGSPKPEFVPSDLLGLRVATVSEVPTPWMCLQEDLRRAGQDPAKLDRVAHGSMSENAEALRRGEIDAAQLFEPFATELLETGAGHVWYAQAKRGPTCYTTLYARKPVLAAKREAFVRMVRAIFRTQNWFHEAGSQRIAEVIQPYFPDMPQQRLAAAIERYKALGIWGQDPVVSRSGYDRLRASLVSGGFVADGVPFEAATDNSLAEEVIRQAPPALKA